MTTQDSPTSAKILAPCHFEFLTLFPDIFETWLGDSILGRARERGLFSHQSVSLRDFGRGKHRVVDDTAYGGGGGMVLRPEPLVDAVEARKAAQPDRRVVVLCPSATGRPLDDRWLRELALLPKEKPTTFLFPCGHYEGIDQRFLDGWVDAEFSIGNFVVTGGELPALLCADALVRHFDGALGHPDGARLESFALPGPNGSRLLEYPHYTKPREFRGREVPPVLLSGDHGAIARWRDEQSLARTRERRPELLIS